MNKPKLVRLLALLLSFALLAVLGSCHGPTSSSHSSNATAKLTLKVGVNGKTLLPADSDYQTPTSYDITLSASGYSTVTKTGLTPDSSGNVSISGLAATTYTVSVFGNYDGSAIVSGTASINLSSGSGSGSVILYYITSGTGTGNAALKIDVSSAVNSGYTISSAVMTLDGTSVDLTTGTSAYTYTGTALTVGSHTISITLTSGAQTALICETLLILQGLTTTATISFSASDFSVNSLSMVDVEGGTFYTSAANATVDEFYIGKYDVTQGLFNSVMGYNPSGFTGNNSLPVETVMWYDAVEFCNRLSSLEGKAPVYTITNAVYSNNHITSATVTADWTKTGYRLPTEMEYMWAAMGGSNDIVGDVQNNVNVYGYSKDYSGATAVNTTTDIEKYAWVSTNADSVTHAVGLLEPNELGLYDMSGNVNQWCWDVQSDSFPASSVINYTGVTSGSANREMRGCTYADIPSKLISRINKKNYNYPTATGNSTGFRIAYSAAPRYQITYNANGATSGSVPIDYNSYTSGETATVLSNTVALAVTGEVFSGWNTQPGGSGVGYSVGSSLSVNSNCTLYAQFVPLTVNTPQLTVTLSSTSSEVSWGASVSLTASVTVTSGSASSYTYAWYVDGVSFGSNGSSLTILSSNLSKGSHSVNVIVTTSGMSFSPASASTITVN